jgi:serine/threonine protein kinase
MRDYACYNCLEKASLSTEKCPKCGYSMKFPLEYPPESIGKYKVLKPISRGFYGITYIVEDMFSRKKVLKVISKKLYEKHKKDFYQECKNHANAAAGTIHIVEITDANEEVIEFSNNMNIDCYVAVLDYIEGPTLQDILKADKPLKANTIAQIAIDMFNLLDALYNKHINHNDLHEENLIVAELKSETKRADQIDNLIKVVAIDLGSVADENKSDPDENRSSDVHWVANYLIQLSEKILDNADETNEQDYRLASILDNYARILLPDITNQRLPNFEEIINKIKDSYHIQSMPWNQELHLKSFSDFYNAQTLEPWYVPDLIVDFDDNWLNKVSSKGPLVITGMRGCGKTMLLKAMQFHARAKSAKLKSSNISEQLSILENDGFLGLYVNCNRLLDEPGINSKEPLFEPLSRIFVAYIIEAIRALRHLKDIDETAVRGDYYKHIAEVCNTHIEGFNCDITMSSETLLEKSLLSVLYSLNKKENKYKVLGNPVNIFPPLADALRKSSKVFNVHFILFLLDDVSTRYLSKENIEVLLSSLIFQDETCSFKFTSEIQTIEQRLYSPGQVEKAKVGRDIETFDLGSAVNEKIRDRSKEGGSYFILDILNKRKSHNRKHPSFYPNDLLGNVSLDVIAKSIVGRENKKQKKEIYHGLSALAGICIGDIGDIIFLYDKILEKYEPNKVPIPKKVQNECYQELCSLRLHEINKRGSDLQAFALSFARASHELLMKSYKENSRRLRVYSSIYIRITEGEAEKIYEKIRKLIDAGIFVFSGSASAPRTLGNDTNPINQFILTYRKTLGISNLIGLTQSDRFELSGKNLENWINYPERGKDILTKTVGGVDSAQDSIEIDSIDLEEVDDFTPKKKTLLDFIEEDEALLVPKYNNMQEKVDELVKLKVPKTIDFKDEEICDLNPDIYLAALGFEERTLHSVKRCLSLINPQKIILVKYDEEGKTQEIIQLIEEKNIEYEILSYDDIKISLNLPDKTILFDISGMSKSLIFHVVRNMLINVKSIYIAHTYAKTYYPLDAEIDKLISSIKMDDKFSALEEISSKIQKGEDLETKKIELYNLLLSDSDESKRRVLVASSNEKYEKLFKLLESREFDIINVLVSNNQEDSKNKLGLMASEVIKMSYPDVSVDAVDNENIQNLLNILTEKYFMYYLYQNCNFELALTGSKSHTVACAAISAKFKISQCWYLAPFKWNVENFSGGVDKTHFYKVEL